MASNTSPIFPKSGKIAWSTLTTANTATDGTGTVGTIFTADATNGSRLDTIKCRPLGTNVASVLRIFINNGSANSTASNNALYREYTLPATTASSSTNILDGVSYTTSSGEIELTMGLVLPAGYKVNVALGTTVSGGWTITGVGGDY